MVEGEETALAVVKLGVGGGDDQAGHDGGGERPHLDCLKKYRYILTSNFFWYSTDLYYFFIITYFLVNLSLVLMT